MQMTLLQPAVSPPITVVHTTGEPLDQTMDASRSLWLPTLTRSARLASLAKPIGLFSRTVAYLPRLTLATRERACEARAREAFKGSHWALCEAMPPGQGDRCLVSSHSCT